MSCNSAVCFEFAVKMKMYGTVANLDKGVNGGIGAAGIQQILRLLSYY